MLRQTSLSAHDEVATGRDHGVFEARHSGERLPSIWRMSNPCLAPGEKSRLVKQLMNARRAVKAAKAAANLEAETQRIGLRTKRSGLGEGTGLVAG